MSDALITHYLEAYIKGRLKPCWIRLDDQHVVVSLDGNPDVYGLKDLQVGDSLDERLDFLIGIEPRYLTEPMVLPFVESGDGHAAHIHVLSQNDALYVLYLDATAEFRDTQEIQQVANEKHILSYHQAKLMDELKRARLAAEEASRLKGRFIANMSHELRTPLSSIMGYARLIGEGQAPEKTQQHSDSIERGAQHLLSLIDNILDQARFEAGQLEVRPAPARLGNLLKDVESIFRPLTEDKGLSLEVRREGRWPEKAEVDALRLRQIVINLVGNAVKFTDTGGVSIVFCWADGRLSIKVIDTGPGIPKEAQGRVFEAFRREKTNADQRAGAGLGLSISVVLAERMGGQLSLESELGKGTTFEINIEAPAVVEKKSSAPRQDARILVAEDDEDISALLEIFLMQAGMNVSLAEDGESAVTKAASAELIFMDMNLPKLDGRSAIRKIRAQGIDVPVIAMSAASGGDDRRSAIESGATEFLPKPIDPDNMIELLGTLIPENE